MQRCSTHGRLTLREIELSCEPEPDEWVHSPLVIPRERA